MTPETPSAPRLIRPGLGARRQALGLDAATPAPPSRESLRDALARIPDLDANDALIASSRPAVLVADPEAAAAASEEVAVASPPSPDLIAAPAELAPAPTDSPAAPESDPPDAPTLPSDPRRPATWRRVLFAAALVGLVAAIPVLVVAGARVISESTAGNFDEDILSPTAPGYEAQVDPTPTAVAFQFDDQGNPNAITFMSLAGAGGGGSIVFVPLDTEVSEPSYGVDRLRTAFDVVADRPALARERLASQTGRVLTVGIEEIIDLGSTGWEQLVAPVAPLQVENPDQVTLADGTVIPPGTVTLAANQVGPYLASANEGESDLARLTRHEALWRAWLDAVAATGRDDAVPGEDSAGIARFARELARGPVSYATLPVTASDEVPNLFLADEPAVGELITETIAAPTAPVPGGRYTVRLLNGVAPEPIPSELVKEIVATGGAVTVVGNGPAFDTDKTEVIYADPADAKLAEVIGSSLGATGKVRLDREAPDTVDLTIVLGSDLLGDG